MSQFLNFRKCISIKKKTFMVMTISHWNKFSELCDDFLENIIFKSIYFFENLVLVEIVA